MSSFDLPVPSATTDVARATICKHHGPDAVRGVYFDIELGTKPGYRHLPLRANGAFEVRGDELHIIGELEQTPTVKALYGAALVTYLTVGLWTVFKIGWYQGLIGMLVGGVLIAVILAGTSAMARRRGMAWMRHLANEIGTKT